MTDTDIKTIEELKKEITELSRVEKSLRQLHEDLDRYHAGHPDYCMGTPKPTKPLTPTP